MANVGLAVGANERGLTSGWWLNVESWNLNIADNKCQERGCMVLCEKRSCAIKGKHAVDVQLIVVCVLLGLRFSPLHFFSTWPSPLPRYIPTPPFSRLPPSHSLIFPGGIYSISSATCLLNLSLFLRAPSQRPRLMTLPSSITLTFLCSQ